MSASSTPILRPRSRRPRARLTAVVDLPTPPLPEATAMMAATPSTLVGLGARPAPGPAWRPCGGGAGGWWGGGGVARAAVPPRRRGGGALLLRRRRGGTRLAFRGQGHHHRGHAGDRLHGRFRAFA